jgi:integrase
VKGEGAFFQRHDHPSCPPLVDVETDGKVDRRRPDHKCQGTWAAQIDMGWVTYGTDEHGRPVRRRLRPTVTAKSRTALSEKLKKKRRELDVGVLADNTTVEQWLNHWLDTIATKRVRPRTLVGYRGYVNTWLIPHLGRHRLEKLKPDHVRALYAAMEAAGRSDSTRRQAHAILRRALVVAEREGRIVRNPAALVDPPPVGTNHHTPLTLTEARLVLAALDTEPAPMAARWLCALLEGMRQGECLGLRWEDVDVPNRRIWITQELYRITGQGLVEADPKSRTSTRAIPMLEPVAFLLEGMPRRGEYVFYGRATDGRKDWGNWKDLLVKAGVCSADMAQGEMPALHAARGTTASLLSEAGVPDKITSEILGHSSIQITQQAYIHGNEDAHRKAMNALGAFVAPPPDGGVPTPPVA